MNDWIVQRKLQAYAGQITEATRQTGVAQIVCGDWQSPMLPFDTAEKIATARNTDMQMGQLQTGKPLTDTERDELHELRGWKRAALQVDSQWDEQAVGRALGFTLGCNIRPRILPAILELKQHLALCTTILQGVILIISKAGFPDTAKDIEGVLKRRKLI